MAPFDVGTDEALTVTALPREREAVLADPGGKPGSNRRAE
jgi:hypothetical protein